MLQIERGFYWRGYARYLPRQHKFLQVGIANELLTTAEEDLKETLPVLLRSSQAVRYVEADAG